MSLLTKELVIDYLTMLENRGVETLPVDESARLILREWMISARKGMLAQRESEREASIVSEVVSVMGQDAVASQEERITREQLAGSLTSIMREEICDAVEKKNIPISLPTITLLEATPEEQLADVYQQMLNWSPAKSLGTLREEFVPGIGTCSATMMFVGDMPSHQEEIEKTPFAGAAGDKLKAIFQAMGVASQQVFLTLLTKWRPLLPQQTTNTRTSTGEEMRVCLPILDAELACISPQCVVLFNESVAQRVLNTSAPLSALRGIQHEYKGVPVYVTEHPRFLLLSDELSRKRAFWEDMLLVMETVGLSITERQRRFFSQ